MTDFLLCSACFTDQGLRLDAAQIGFAAEGTCPNCGLTDGRKLDSERIAALAHRFFVWGSMHRFDYGAAPLIQFNTHQSTSIEPAPWFASDLLLIEKAIHAGFFYYGPRLWMAGEIEPLKALQEPASREAILDRILAEYPDTMLTTKETFYRLRKDPAGPGDMNEYDSPPTHLAGIGRLDSEGFPVLYGSQDLQICLHECRVAAEDNLFVATLAPARELKLLNLTELLAEDANEFESLDTAIHMLFLAGSHSYHITRQIALAAHAVGYDGLVYPSYFSLLRTGAMPFETIYGISA